VSIWYALVMNNTYKVRVLLAVPLGLLGSSLRTYLSTVDELESVVFANSSDEALHLAAEGKPDFLILDIQLISPLQNYQCLFDFLNNMKKVSSNTLPIVLVDDQIQKQVALNAGCARVLYKGALGDQLRILFQQAINPAYGNYQAPF